jgi:hypothetical protein
MATVNLSWTNPGDLSDITGIKVYRRDGDVTSASISTQSERDAFATEAGSPVATVNKSGGTLEYTAQDTTAAAGTSYTYAAFSYNGGGLGPGDLTDSVVTT